MNKINEAKWVSTVKVIGLIDFRIETFSQKLLGIWNQILYESLQEHGNENLYKCVGSHDLDGRMW